METVTILNIDLNVLLDTRFDPVLEVHELSFVEQTVSHQYTQNLKELSWSHLIFSTNTK